MNALTLEDAGASYGEVQVLDGVTLAISHGEHVALVGGSGAGKSTLLSLLFDRKRRDLAIVPQDLGLVQTLSVFHNVYMGRLAAHGTLYNMANLIRPFAREVAGVRAVLEPLGLAERMWSSAGELSGGQRQRTAVARALYQAGAVLLADEPVSALDRPMAEIVMQTLTSQYRTSVLAMHDVEMALRYTHRVIGIDKGRIVLDRPSAALAPRDLRPLYMGEEERA